MARRKSRIVAVVWMLAFGVSLLVSSCGETETSGNEIDRAFVAEMVPHHQQAIDVAEAAQKRGQSGFVRDLADDIVTAQSSEVALMGKIDSDLDNHGIGAGDLGLSRHQMGMAGHTAALESAQPFDRAFIDMMVAHHAGAIRMARVELAEGENGTLKSLAERIIAAQSREIRAMNAYRVKAFGAPSPAGGVPPEEQAAHGAGHGHGQAQDQRHGHGNGPGMMGSY